MATDIRNARNIVDDFVVTPCAEQIGLVHEARDYLIVNKPSGLLSLSGKNPLNIDSVHHRLVQQWPTALLVHRLDYGTSGLLIIALNKPFAAELNRQFQAKRVQKQYQALVHGVVTDEQGEVEASIARDDANFPKMKICAESGKAALTRYKVMARYGDANESKADVRLATTRLELLPMTGRTHQLRIHCAHMGHPIVGCDIYGHAATRPEGRLRLHAGSIAFVDPSTEKPLAYRCEVPF